MLKHRLQYIKQNDYNKATVYVKAHSGMTDVNSFRPNLDKKGSPKIKPVYNQVKQTCIIAISLLAK